MSTLTPIVDLVPPPMPVEKPEHDATTTQVEGRKLPKLNLPVALAKHFTPEEKREGKVWLGEHPEVPVVDDGVFPDPYTANVFRVMKRISDRGKGWGPEAIANKDFDFDAGFDQPEDDDVKGVKRKKEPAELIPDSSANNEINARAEAASVAHHGPEKPDHPIECFMADADERLAPYIAFLDGQSLGRIVTTYGIANIRLFLDTVERWLDQLERDRPYFNRKYFLTKAKRAVEIRRRDAGVGAARAAAERAAMAKPAEPESTEKRGAEWATINHISIPRARATRPARKKDEPWVGTPLGPLGG